MWDLPDITSSSTALKALGLIVNDWQLSTIWTGDDGQRRTPCTQFSYQNGGGNVNLTGSPDFGAAHPHRRRSRQGLQQRSRTGSSTPPRSRGRSSAASGSSRATTICTAASRSVLDLSIARNIRLGGGRMLQLRVDMFNAPNKAQITGRNTTLNLTSPSDPVTPLNLPYDANGNILPNRVRPNQAGFGAVNAYQAARNIQGYIRFSF